MMVGETNPEVRRQVFQEWTVEGHLGLLESPHELLAEDNRRRERTNQRTNEPTNQRCFPRMLPPYNAAPYDGAPL
jgi:hypothetical protein